MSDDKTTENGKYSINLDPKVAGLSAYLFGWVSGVVVFFIEKENKQLRFHGLQSILFNLAWVVVLFGYGIIMIILSVVLDSLSEQLGALAGLLLFFGSLFILFIVFIIWILLMVKAFNLEKWKLPVIGSIAERYS